MFMPYKDYVKELIDNDGFSIVDGMYSIYDSCKNPDGCWIDDIISFEIQCPDCGRKYSLFADTYHSWFSFKKYK